MIKKKSSLVMQPVLIKPAPEPSHLKTQTAYSNTTPEEHEIHEQHENRRDDVCYMLLVDNVNSFKTCGRDGLHPKILQEAGCRLAK